MSIHSTAIIDPKAKIHPSCKIGPYCVIGADVELGKGCHLVSHVAIEGPTKIGADNGFFPFSSIGMAPQDLTYAGEPTRLEIGDHNEIREFVTINRGTVKGGGLTRIGDYNLIMAYTHIAHDCQIGSHIIMANAATLGGHVTVEDWANVGALCPGAPLCAHWNPFHHRRRLDHHARCSAVFEDVRRARNPCLRPERGRPGAARIHERTNQETASRLSACCWPRS